MIGRTSRIVVWPPATLARSVGARCRSAGTTGRNPLSPTRPGRRDKCPVGRRFHRGTDGSILEGVGKHGDDEEISTCHATRL